MRSTLHARGSFAWHSRTVQKLSHSGSQMLEKMNADTRTKRCPSPSSPNELGPHMVKHTSSMMEVRVHRITSISCLFSSISLRFSLERCMKHTATRHAWHCFSTSVCDFFFGGGFSTLLTCALCLLGSSVIDQCSSLRHDCLIKMQRAETHQWEQRASVPDAGEALGELLVHLHVQRVS